MGVTVDLYTWPQVVVAPGAEVTLLHWVVDGNGHSVIDPDRWYWMSAVPDNETATFKPRMLAAPAR
jgi:hypothetical protein